MCYFKKYLKQYFHDFVHFFEKRVRIQWHRTGKGKKEGNRQAWKYRNRDVRQFMTSEILLLLCYLCLLSIFNVRPALWRDYFMAL